MNCVYISEQNYARLKFLVADRMEKAAASVLAAESDRRLVTNSVIGQIADNRVTDRPDADEVIRLMPIDFDALAGEMLGRHEIWPESCVADRRADDMSSHELMTIVREAQDAGDPLTIGARDDKAA